MLRSNLARRSFWLIARHHHCRIEPFTIDLTYGEVLPVFGFEEEAELFLRLGMLGTGWRARRTTAGELISILYGPCAGVERVVLDPLPEILCEATVGPVNLARKYFVRTIVCQGGLAEA
jgi:hypothetical protein